MRRQELSLLCCLHLETWGRLKSPGLLIAHLLLSVPTLRVEKETEHLAFTLADWGGTEGTVPDEPIYLPRSSRSSHRCMRILNSSGQDMLVSSSQAYLCQRRKVEGATQTRSAKIKKGKWKNLVSPHHLGAENMATLGSVFQPCLCALSDVQYRLLTVPISKKKPRQGYTWLSSLKMSSCRFAHIQITCSSFFQMEKPLC